MSDSLETEAEQGEPGQLITLAEAATRLGCHVETLRLRVRTRRLKATRGPHGRYYITAADFELLTPPRRMKRRVLGSSALATVQRHIDDLLQEPGRLMVWQSQLVKRVRDDPRADPPLYRAMAVRSLRAQGYNTVEISGLLGVSVRQVHRLRHTELLVALARARRRQLRTEQGRLRREARLIVSEIQRQLELAGFRAARRDPRVDVSGAREGRNARVALVRELRGDQRLALLGAGLTSDQVAAISLIGIGSDEYHELVVNGLATTAR